MFAHAVLGGLALCGGAVLMTAPGLSDILRRGPFGRHSPSAAARTIESLYKKGLVALTGTKGERVATLTAKGTQLAYLTGLTLPKPDKKSWDELWYMVAFDIPVDKRKARTALRLTLKRIGFVEYQKSLYIYPRGCESELDFIAQYFGVAKYVRRFYATSLEDEARYRRLFHLT
jgi:DNA-binding transcriptional regulator PaaX